MVQDIRNMCGAFVAALNGHEATWGPFDLVHGHDWLAGPGIQQLKGQGKKVVFTMHSTEGGRNGDMGKGHPGIKEIERCGCGAADKLICVSGVLKEEVQGCCGADGNKTTVIYNGIHAGPIVNMPWEDEWTGNTKMDKGWSPMDPMFLFVGRHTAQKGCDVLIEAIPMILQCRGDAKFVIVGDGHLKAHNEHRAYQMGVMHACCFTGSLKSGSDHLKALFKACDAVVIPSRNEPFGIVVLEAWASGKPVVATTSGGPRDFVKPGQDGYLVDPNPGSVAWGCCKILENFEHSRWMGRNAQLKTMREFTWEYIALETEKVYYDLLNLKEAPRTNDSQAGYSMSSSMLQEVCFKMGKDDPDQQACRGIALQKLLKLLVASVGGDASMTWMGSEFGQIDVVDMPRPGNGFNDECSRIKYELADNADLKFHQLETFEASLNSAASSFRWTTSPQHEVLQIDEEGKTMTLRRGKCTFAFNFHTHDTKEVQVGPGAESLKCALDTNEKKFGGSAAEQTAVAVKGGKAIVSLAPRAGVVLVAA
jgi:glycosyltransferase involved in cell wall biosynthesis